MMYYFYVLYGLKAGSLYKGSTGQLLKRWPLILLYYETYDNKKEAIRREYWSKTLEGGKALWEILVEKLLLTEAGRLNDQSIDY